MRSVLMRLLFAAAALMLMTPGAARAQAVESPFDASYSLIDLGSPSVVPTSYGGITFYDADTLLLAGAANGAGGAIYAVDVSRDVNGHIDGFVGTPTLFATAPFIDGGLAYHQASGVLFYTTYSNNTIGQIKPGSSSPDKIIDLTALGVSFSTGAFQFTPDGFGGAGSLKIASYSAGTWYDAALVADGNGTFNIVGLTQTATGLSGPEGIVYIAAGNDEFAVDSVLVSAYGANKVIAYEVNANGDPVIGTARDFITGLTGAEGATIDPLTGDFLFSTFGASNRVILVTGFIPPAAIPTPAALGGGLLLLTAMAMRRARR